VPRLVEEVERLRRVSLGEAAGGADLSAVVVEPPGNWGVVHFPGRRYPALATQGDTFSTLRDSALLARDLLRSHDVEGGVAELDGLVTELSEALAYYERVLRDRGFGVPYSNPGTAAP